MNVRRCAQFICNRRRHFLRAAAKLSGYKFQQYAIIDISLNGAQLMPAVTVRNLPEATHRALKLRAAHNGRSTEAEIRIILEDAVSPKSRLKIGSELAAFGSRYGGIELKIKRDPRPIEPATFE
jgi:plasmid stability protein